MIFVLDASVVIKWFTKEGEDHLQEADNVLEMLDRRKIGLVEPDLLWMEIANVLVMAKKFTLEQVDSALARLDELNIRMKRVDREVVGRAVETSTRYGISVYDGVYVATAVMEGAVLVSDNPKHHSKIKDGVVMMLKDLKM